MYLAIGVAISFIVPFPYSFIAIIGTLLLLSYFVRRRQFGRIGLFGSSSMFGGSGYRTSSSNCSLNYYCMNCGRKHNQSACPKCGSKMKRVGS
jgi:hypothetical protein